MSSETDDGAKLEVAPRTILTEMKRRNFLQATGVSLVATCLEAPPARPGADDLVLPKQLRSGDLVGLITPSTYVADPDRLALATQTLKYFGLRARVGKGVGKKSGYFGNSADERLDDLHTMFRDPEVNAVFAIRGGYGAQQLLDRIDYDLIRSHPKIFLGYSDITALHLAINKYARLVTFHGPIVLSRFTDFTLDHFRRALFNPKPIGKLANPPEEGVLRPAHSVRTIRPGRATGPLIGGNLTLVSTTMGTPYEIDTRGKILFLEDIDEETYRIDRMLTQLRLAKKLEQAAGIIFGECNGCAPRDYKPSMESNYSLGEVLDAILGPLKVPVVSGLTIGHTSDQLTLPVGVTATLDATAGALEINAPCVTAS
jgi:muramoyltetrapeptide carboxypeptidase